jgi:hypothetical protein
MAVRHLADEPFAAFSAAIAAGHVRRCAGFIDEQETLRIAGEVDATRSKFSS